MDRHLSLVEKPTEKEEKRLFPRFPFTSLTFKATCSDLTFQVRNISFTGMQVSLKSGRHILKENSEVEGEIHCHGRAVRLKAKVLWTSGDSIGLVFQDPNIIRKFLDLKNIIKELRPLHLHSLGIEKPSNLKYWLKSASTLEIFVWTHSDGELEKFQILFMDQFIEWIDGEGLRTGKILDFTNLETPLFEQNEFTFLIDAKPEEKRLSLASDVASQIGLEQIPEETLKFMRRKLEN